MRYSTVRVTHTSPRNADCENVGSPGGFGAGGCTEECLECSEEEPGKNRPAFPETLLLSNAKSILLNLPCCSCQKTPRRTSSGQRDHLRRAGGLPMKGYLMTSLLLAGIAALASHVEGGHRKLSAPTYYIATRADYTGDPARIHVRGASNLPAGARLSISIYDRVGQGSTLLSDETVATVDGEGFFEV